MKIKKEHPEIAEKAIEEAAKMKEQLFTPKDGDMKRKETFVTEHLEEGIEHFHKVAQLDREEAANALKAKLDRTSRAGWSVYRRWWIGGAAAAVVVALSVTLFLRNQQSPADRTLPVVKMEKITVPTLIHEQNETIVAWEPLDLQYTNPVYVAAKNKRPAEVADKDTVVYEKVVIPAGYTYTVQLADGSSVLLNAGSELRYPSRFEDTLRAVELKGEAYFRVAKSDIPFVVKAGAAAVKVYGTEFNLFYAEKLGLSEAVLVKGKIGMKVAGKELQIQPNQRVYCATDLSLKKENVNPADYIGWMDNSFKYNAAELGRIAFDIGQWYGIEIRVSPELAKQTYSLKFDKSSTVDWVLEALGMIVEKNIKKEGGAYYIK